MFGVHRFGKENPNYINGKGREPYPIEFNNTLKESIRKRDNYKCQLCFIMGKHVHHINYNKQDCNKENLITLCLKCNNKVNANRNYWFAYFRYLIDYNLYQK